MAKNTTAKWAIERGFKQNLLKNHFKGGRNRQRRIAQQLGYPVIHLHRTAIGSIQLQPPGEAPLPKGCYRPSRIQNSAFARPNQPHTI